EASTCSPRIPRLANETPHKKIRREGIQRDERQPQKRQRHRRARRLSHPRRFFRRLPPSGFSRGIRIVRERRQAIPERRHARRGNELARRLAALPKKIQLSTARRSPVGRPQTRRVLASRFRGLTQRTRCRSEVTAAPAILAPQYDSAIRPLSAR